MGRATLRLRDVFLAVAFVAVLNGAAIATGRREYCIPATIAGIGAVLIVFGIGIPNQGDIRRGCVQSVIIVAGIALLIRALMTYWVIVGIDA